jgi:hypothetical protein
MTTASLPPHLAYPSLCPSYFAGGERKCSCKHSKCVKLYCVCWAAGACPASGSLLSPDLSACLNSQSLSTHTLSLPLSLFPTSHSCLCCPLYAGLQCNNCLCRDCFNTPENAEFLKAEQARTVARNPSAFTTKVREKSGPGWTGCSRAMHGLAARSRVVSSGGGL